jgi:choline-sulfatase
MFRSINSTSANLSSVPASPAAGEDQRHILGRRGFLTALGATLAGGALAYASLGTLSARPVRAAVRTPGRVERPNIILIITDQERYPMHWPDGWVQANLPARQRLAQSGLSFRRTFCNATMCSASRSTLFTGLHPAQHGVIHTLTEGGAISPIEPTLPTDIQTMGKMLGSVGYNVVFKGKWHMSKGEAGGNPTTEQVAAYGFNDWEPTAVANDTAVENFGGGCANWDQRIADQAVNFLAAQTAADTADEPFMLIVSLGNPHDVLSYPNTWDQAEEGGCNNYTDFDFEQGISLPVNVVDSLENKPTCQLQSRNAAQVYLGPLATPQEMTRYANFYAGLVKEVDGHVGAVLDAIPEEIRDNTIVFYTSDHGEMGMAHGAMRQKAFQVYEETVNIPLIIHNPVMFPTAQATDAYASLIDLMPTLATLAQVPNRETYTFYGTDLTPLLTSPDTPVQYEILFTFDDIWAANPNGAAIHPITGEEVPSAPKNIRAIFVQDDDGEWKYARYFDPNGVKPPQFEMYHLRTGLGLPVDPFEMDNLAHQASSRYDDPAIVAKREQLAQRLAALEAERLQPLPTSEIYLPMIQK